MGAGVNKRVLVTVVTCCAFLALLQPAADARKHKTVDQPETTDQDADSSTTESAGGVNPGGSVSDASVPVPSAMSLIHHDAPKPKRILQGSAEMHEQGADATLQAEKAAQVYKQGVAALGSNNFRAAAEYFKRAGDGFRSSVGDGKFLGESLYAEAQSRRMIGQVDQSTRLYRLAIDQFQKYDPLSPYLKASFDQLKIVAPKLAAGIQTVDRNVILKGRVTDTASERLKAERAMPDLSDPFVKSGVLKTFAKMTCLETAELGSNYYTAPDKYVPIKVHGRNLAINASSDFMAPFIRIKLNGQFYSVALDLPDLGASRRTVFVVTDGKEVLAIDPGNYDVWKLNGTFDNHGGVFTWKKLTHIKRKPPKS